MGWILANLFILAVVLIGAALLLAGGAAFRWLDPGPGLFGMWCAAVLSGLSLFALYYISRALHGFVDRRINRPRKTG